MTDTSSPKAEKKLKVHLLRDTWNENGDRLSAAASNADGIPADAVPVEVGEIFGKALIKSGAAILA